MTHFQCHCLLVNMPFTKEAKILIKNLFELKGYNARHLVRELPRKKAKISAASTSCCNRYGLLVSRPSSRQCRWRDARTDLADELVLHKNGKSRKNNYLHTVLNSMILLCTKYYKNWLMNVEDIANQTSFIFSMTKKTHFWGSWFPR